MAPMPCDGPWCSCTGGWTINNGSILVRKRKAPANAPLKIPLSRSASKDNLWLIIKFSTYGTHTGLHAMLIFDTAKN